ncbi:MAG: hypothetical protein EPO16_08400 [Dehalococcoidia bacterium]|nr:MAG: hypothetical protein EPO16_08400 [Dehalococcoidia bacterium]
MDTRARAIVGVLGATVIVLAVALVVVIARDDDGSTAMHGGTTTPSMGMMRAMGNMDSDAMLTHMRDVLGNDGYQRMLKHMQGHRAGGPMAGDPAIDGMMHQMMDGMMQQMPDDSGGMMPRATGTPTATR